MKLFSITDDNVVLYDTRFGRVELRRFGMGEGLAGAATPPVETVLCVVEGQLEFQVDGKPLALGTMEGVQIPAGQAWTATVGNGGAKLLRVDSPHPTFAPERALMPRLESVHRFAVADGHMLIYTDYVRGGILNFAPGFAADKHFHQDAEEIFWFFQGTCRVTTAEGAVLAPAGTIVYTAPGEWHIIENVGDEPLLMFLTVTPNIVPSHTFFDAHGAPLVRSWAPLRGR